MALHDYHNTPYAVFGWYQNLFTGVEREHAHTVQAGYQKGASHANVDLLFNVASRLSTASKLCLSYRLATFFM